MKQTRSLFILITVCFSSISLFAQPGAEIELKKPEKYENRKLGAEKTGEKKFTLPRRFYHNTTTHYNYYFNANTRLNELVGRAKASFKEDFTKLLPFYNYTLEETSKDGSELDSIVYKATAGILLHDLRSDWVDNMYMILAKAYFFRNDLDSAAQTLQYINFAFAPKEDDAYHIPIGSNASNEKGEFSISTQESKNIFKKVISRPPSRNLSFIWQIRTHIEKNELPEAAGLIEILRNDPHFPKRLDTDLDEMIAYWFYKQNNYDSAAHYLSRALPNAANGEEKARWEYLTGQLYQLAGNYEKSIEYYTRSIKHTNDPVLDVYARLNSISINRSDKKDFLQSNIDELVKMAKREKYENYRDILYYAAAKIELDRKNYDQAQHYLLKSVEFTTNNPAQRSKSFLLLGDLNYNRKVYTSSYNFYDSLDVNEIKDEKDKARVNTRKPALKDIADNANIINKEDSLQAIARMPVEARDELLKKLAKKLRKEQGLKEEENIPSGNLNVAAPPTSLFNDNTKSGDFYFYNPSFKAKGFSEFKATWGQRPNVDNWRRQAAVDRQNPSMGLVDDVLTPDAPATSDKSTKEASYAGLFSDLPLGEEKLAASNKQIHDALFALGKSLMEKIEDYPSAIKAFEELLRRFPDTENKEEALFYLVYAYSKTGDLEKANQYKELLKAQPDNKWTKLLQSKGASVETNKSEKATKAYEQVYNHFIEGRFTNALNEKIEADKIYGKNYWTPQLLFIEAIYYVKQRQDSAAINVLTDLVKLHKESPIAERAQTMIDVLRRRSEIEDYLANLSVSVPQEMIVKAKPIDLPKKQPEEKPATAPATKPLEVKPVEKPIEKPVTEPVKPPAKEDIKKDTVAVVPPKPEPPAIVTKPAVTIPTEPDATPPAPVIAVKNFTHNPADQHYVVVLLDKVNEVYVGEAKNAFNRYNREKFYNQKIDLSTIKLDEQYNLLLQGPFTDANAAVDYIEKVKPVASGRIIPWLSVEKYSFILINNTNLELLKTNKDMEAYKQLLKLAFPGKF